jgi:hypothetical protein
MRLTFVVGTGRCGSTLLSRILSEHPDVLSMSEVFGTLRAAARGEPFARGDLDGHQFWRLLASPFPMIDEMISSGLRITELPYRGRFLPAAAVPLICHYVLPMLTQEPDALFDELAGQVPAWPRRPAAAQCEAFFGYLAGRLGRAVVVERSAASLNLVGALHQRFPAARFIHLHRDGPDCALSMSRHPVFRRELLAIAAARQARLPAGSTEREFAAALPERFAGLVFPPFDAAKLMAYPIPVTAFGRYRWSPMVCAGLDALRRLPAGSWLSVRYEDLLRDPAATLATISAFIGADAPRPWLAAAGDMTDPARGGTAARLPAATLAALQAACEPGTRALAEISPLAGPDPVYVPAELLHRAGQASCAGPGGQPREQGGDGRFPGRAGQ